MSNLDSRKRSYPQNHGDSCEITNKKTYFPGDLNIHKSQLSDRMPCFTRPKLISEFSTVCN